MCRMATIRFVAKLMLLACMASTAHAALTCTASASGIAFGVYNQFNLSPTDSTGSVSIACDLTFPSAASKVNYTFSLSSGSSGTMLARQMQSTPNVLPYNIYTSSTYSAIWGDGSGGTATVSGSMKLGSPGTGWSQTDTYTLYGRIPAGQDAMPGTYADMIIVTVTY